MTKLDGGVVTRRKRRNFLLACLGCAFAPLGLLAADSDRRRVGVLMATSRGDADMVRILVERLAKAGFVEGRNLELHRESIELDPDRAPQLARRLVNARPDVLYAMAEPLVDALKTETRSIPIVFVFVTEPVQRGYIRDYARPGGNITGVTDRYVETGVKRLELLRETLPQAKRVAFVADFGDPVGLQAWRSAASRMGFVVIDADITRGTMEAVLENTRAQKVDCLFPIGPLRTRDKSDGNPIFLRFAERHRLPAIFSSTSMVTHKSGLMSLDVDHLAVMRQGADMVIRVLRGEKPETMAVQEPDRFTIAVNLKTAKALGITIPRSVLLRADEVVE